MCAFTRSLHRPTRALIDLAAFRHNLDAVRRIVGPHVGIMAVIKANAYGHGIIPLAREAVRWGVQALAVATADEALDLRETTGFGDIPILLIGPSFAQDAKDLQAASISVTIGSHHLLRHHLAVARERGAVPRLHVKIDTGMGRYGLAPEDTVFLEMLKEMPEALEGLMTHFSVSDELHTKDMHYTAYQNARFERTIARVHAAGMRPILHAANSGAILNHPATHFEIVRPGMMLYGANPDPRGKALALKQVLTLATRIVSIHEHKQGESISYGRRFTMPRDGRIGILPIGYGDGFPRALSGKAAVLIRGQRVPVVGRICMDQTLVDLTEFPAIRVGDEVVLYGSQGNHRISLEEVARQAGTIPYEITCQLGLRIPRVVIDSETKVGLYENPVSVEDCAWEAPSVEEPARVL